MSSFQVESKVLESEKLESGIALLDLLSEPRLDQASVLKAIEAGADVNETSRYGFTPLMFAVLMNYDAGIARLLLERNADVNAATDDGVTALMWSLLTETYDHTAHDMPAALAGDENRRETAMEIIKRGANVNAVCSRPMWEGWTPLHFAALDPDRNVSLISALLDAGASAEAKTLDDVTPLMRAAERGRSPEAAHMLIKAGADVNAAGSQEGREGWTPLLYALNSPYRSLSVVRELVLSSADVNVTAPNGYTPLFFALNMGDDPAFAELLIKSGADAGAKVRDGSSFFDWALAKNYKKVECVISENNKTSLAETLNKYLGAAQNFR